MEKLSILRFIRVLFATVSYFYVNFYQRNKNEKNFFNSVQLNTAYKLKWKTAAPQETGLDSSKIESFNNSLTSTEVTSCIIVKDGVIVSEYYKTGYNRESVFAMHSVSKSVTGAVVGIAITNGYFKLAITFCKKTSVLL